MGTSKQEFIDSFSPLVDELVEYLESIKMPADSIAWYRQSLEHNCVGGKLNRGLSVIDSLCILTGKDTLDAETYKKASVLGWAVELLQAFFLVADDMMDQSKTRRGQPCWYLMPKVGNIAINDAFMLEAAIYFLLKKHFKQESYYVDLLELFHDVTFQTELGQMLDLLTAPEDEVDLSKFSLAKHSFIVIYKTAFYSFYLPVALAMFMAGVTDSKDLKQAENILVPLGEYFQVQDDYLDCYGDPAVTGKIGTDILDNKCGWLINKALQKASSSQRSALDSNYGQKDSSAETKVKAIFRELEIEREYQEYEESIVGNIRSQIDSIDESRGLKKQVFEVFLNKIYKRSK
ncbi:Farnesyl pyrophosphate synthase [Taphrina deformans PYCC 5710]|uniref:Farnesyl pyrophosphate synthase n=1 Tax=Taphrina deformans (strain PYCC 5710 / ATCC 11124 / CBS 356.35 / IMI 108563 / JCM 9778 / NBRC 8474) TaxID=1097556 RepID=R4X8G6_TAPDE|nr:Farnesyl pyrophosphate synthase [Taphrina deformans PYCC 5710]|eukprot:CCG81894.1 Farnesyl pyrophosphate synthase [Taphrina deformans PYCC 5710]